jgi:hypothetical protein
MSNDNPFDFLNSINATKKNLVREDGRGASEYIPFIMNRGLSQHPDTVAFANEMNRRHFMDKQMQYEFLLHSVRPRRRFGKWAKKDDGDLLEKVCELFGCSTKKAEEMRSTLGDKRLKEVVKECEAKVGGV